MWYACPCRCMCMHERGENGITQLPSFWHRNSALSLTHNQAPLLCLRLLSTPCFYTVQVPAVSLPGSTSLPNFIKDGAMFPNPSLLRTQWCGPTLTLWRRVLLSNGQLAPNVFMQWCSSGGSEIMANHNIQPEPGFTALWCLCPNISK